MANIGSSIRAGCANELTYRGGKALRRRYVCILSRTGQNILSMTWAGTVYVLLEEA